MFNFLKLQRMARPLFFATFFIWAQLWIHLWFLVSLRQEMLCNSHGPFGIFFPSWVFLGIALGILIGIGIFYQKIPSLFYGWPLFLIVVGGLSNVFERVVFGCIIDFVSVFSFFPVFNIADSMITLGVVGGLWRWLVKENFFKEKKNTEGK